MLPESAVPPAPVAGAPLGTSDGFGVAGAEVAAAVAVAVDDGPGEGVPTALAVAVAEAFGAMAADVADLLGVALVVTRAAAVGTAAGPPATPRSVLAEPLPDALELLEPLPLLAAAPVAGALAAGALAVGALAAADGRLDAAADAAGPEPPATFEVAAGVALADAGALDPATRPALVGTPDDFAEGVTELVGVGLGVLAAGGTTTGGATAGGFAVGVVVSSPALMPIKVNTVASTAIATTAPTTQAVLLG